MKNSIKLVVIVFILLSFQFAKSQNVTNKGFELMGKSPKTIHINQMFTKNTEIFPFDGKTSTIFGLDLKANIRFNDEKSTVRIILIDKKGAEYLVYETYPLIDQNSTFTIKNLCEGRFSLNGVEPQSLKIEVSNAILKVSTITYSTLADQTVVLDKTKHDKNDLQNSRKISQINNSIKSVGLPWVADETGIYALSDTDKRKLFNHQFTLNNSILNESETAQSGKGLCLKSSTAGTMVEK